MLNETTIEGGGAIPAVTTTPITISPLIPDFGFLPGAAGFGAPISSADGLPATQAGSHPYQLTVATGYPSEKPQDVSAAGHLRDVAIDLPPGEIVNPNSTSQLCHEEQLVSNSCPEASQIGTVIFTTATLGGSRSASRPYLTWSRLPARPRPSASTAAASASSSTSSAR